MFDNNNNNNNNNDNSVLIDVDSRKNKKQKILCVLCRIQLDCVNPEENRFKCPRCKNSYQLGYNQINEFDDDLESSHEDEFDDADAADNEGLISASNDLEFDDNDDENTNGDIPLPPYMKSSPTTEIIEYREG